MEEEEIKKAADATSTSEEKSEEKEEEFDYEKEMERRGVSKYTPQEKAVHSFKGIIGQLKGFGLDPASLLGIKSEEKKEDAGENKQQTPFSIEELRSIIKEEGGSVKSIFAINEIETRLSKLAKNDKEKMLIKHLYDSRITRSDSLDEDLDDAHWLANKNRLKVILAEIGRGKGSEKKSSGDGTGQKREEKTKPKVSEKEERFAKRTGLVWSDDAGRYISKARAEYLKKQKR